MTANNSIFTVKLLDTVEERILAGGRILKEQAEYFWKLLMNMFCVCWLRRIISGYISKDGNSIPVR